MSEQLEFKINIADYISTQKIAEIAEEELRRAFRRQFKTEGDVERVLTNLTLEYVFALVAEQWDGDFSELLKAKIRQALEDDNSIKYQIFRRRDAWDRTESPAVAILDEELKNSRPLIRECVEKHIREYPFHELDREHIGEVIYDVIMDRILSAGKEAQP